MVKKMWFGFPVHLFFLTRLFNRENNQASISCMTFNRGRTALGVCFCKVMLFEEGLCIS